MPVPRLGLSTSVGCCSSASGAPISRRETLIVPSATWSLDEVELTLDLLDLQLHLIDERREPQDLR